MRYKTQADLADALGTDQTSVSIWESGKGFPKSETIKKLLELDATVEEIFEFPYNEKHGLIKAEPNSNDLLKEFKELKARMDVLEGKKEPTVVAQIG